MTKNSDGLFKRTDEPSERAVPMGCDVCTGSDDVGQFLQHDRANALPTGLRVYEYLRPSNAAGIHDHVRTQPLDLLTTDPFRRSLALT